MHATLLEANPETTALLEAACGYVDIPITLVGTLESLLRAARRASVDDLLMLDCTPPLAECRARCQQVVAQSSIPVLIVYSDGTLQRVTQPRIQSSITWLAAHTD